MQLNIKVIKKWQPPHFYINPPFQGYPPFLAKFLLPLQVTPFFEGPNHPPLIRGRGGSMLYDLEDIVLNLGHFKSPTYSNSSKINYDEFAVLYILKVCTATIKDSNHHLLKRLHYWGKGWWEMHVITCTCIWPNFVLILAGLLKTQLNK